MRVRVLSVLGVLAAALSAACDRGTSEPEPLLAVAMAATGESRIFDIPDGRQTVNCSTRIAVSVTGDPRARAAWTGGVLRVYVGPQRTTLGDTATLSAAELQAALGDSIVPGMAASVAYPFGGLGPFRVEAELRYRQAGHVEDETVTASAACGPDVLARFTTDPARRGTWLVGRYSTADSILLYVTAAYESSLAWVVYEVNGTRDSIPYAPPVRIPVQAAWGLTPSFRVQVRDQGGKLSDWAQAQPGGIQFHPVRPGPAARATLDALPADAVVDVPRGRLYAAVPAHGAVHVYALPGMTEGARLTLPVVPALLELTPSGDTLVALSRRDGSLAVVDVARGAAPVRWTLGGVRTLHGLRIGASGQAIAMATMDDGTAALLAVNLGTGAHRVIPGTGSIPHPQQGVARSLDRTRMLVGLGCVWEVAEERLGPCSRITDNDFEVGRPLAGDRAGARWVYSARVLDASLATLADLPGNGAPGAWPLLGHGRAVSPDGASVFMSASQGIMRVRVADGVYLERLQIPGADNHMRVSDDGTMMAVWTDKGGIAGAPEFAVMVVDPR